ncbi:peptidylprolyl isomerase [Breoghania sp. L-A4]|uniref:peptidylprolyl isomerase n=1 Tax=Breoghania sp. L-A4 TaxID=2304600 RepID=UPI000E35A069|nr:peptidylprolyl isomerase [Breoghania sp. L-A4]AXS38791.1 peptidyl-prolyl cis-trans isomerase [Breoghania sp. L-A4]
MTALRSPFLHFLLLGGLLFAAKLAWWQPVPDMRQTLRVPAYELQLALKDFFAQKGRPASPSERRAIFETLIDQRILLDYAVGLGLHRQPITLERLAKVVGFIKPEGGRDSVTQDDLEEAIRLGLHRSDLVMRRMLIDGAKRIIRAVVLVREPESAMLEEHLRDHPEEFRRPRRTRLTQLLVNELKHGARTEARARALLQKVSAVPTSEATTLGDKVFVDTELPAMIDKDLERMFGAAFVSDLDAAPVGEWYGPIRSHFGLHIVFVHERIPAHVPPLAEIETQVRAQLLQTLADDWLRLRLAQLREAYDIVDPEGLPCSDC